MSNRRSFSLFVLALVWVLALACSKKPDAAAQQKALEQTFDPLIAKYELAVARKEVARDADARPVLRGRLFAVREPGHGDGNYMKYDLFPEPALLELMPPELVAKSPDEVRTMVHVACTDELIGSYTDGTSAFAWNCMLGVVDLETNKLAFVGTFRGPDPPKTLSAGGIKIMHGDKPYPEIAKALAELPRE